MKILHTADWHLGKILHKHDVSDAFEYFFQWLIKLIKSENVDAILISGDIFDLANPAAKDRKLYFDCLKTLHSTGIQIIVTGGNHDSVGLLNAPNQLLQSMNIHIIGGATQPLEDEIVLLKNKKNIPALAVAAVPFLRDKDLRTKDEEESYKNRTEAIQAGIKKHYQNIAVLCQELYPDLPAIAMGHLYAKGSIGSDSEREIHVGNAAVVESAIFPESFHYVALGHIHRPQIIGGKEHIRYSGSPIALSFSEKSDKKQVLILEIEKHQIKSIQPHLIPPIRSLIKLSGTFEEVQTKLNTLDPKTPLTSFVEIEVVEEHFNTSIISQTVELVSNFAESDKFKILKDKVIFKEQATNAAQHFTEGTHVEDLKPMDVFNKRLEAESLDANKLISFQEAFQELLDSVQETDHN